MADPRAAVNHLTGPHPHELHTFPHDATIVYSATVEDGSSQVGFAVSIESDNVVTLADSGENVLGKLLKVESDGFCVVQTDGYMTLPGGTGATLTAGLKIVGDLGGVSTTDEGYIQAVSTEDTVSRGMIIDASTTTAVIVKL